MKILFLLLCICSASLAVGGFPQMDSTLPVDSTKITVVGCVNHPQAFSFDGAMTLKQAIEKAEGPLVKNSRVVVTRRLSSGRMDDIKFDVKNVLKGKTGDFPLQAGDIVFVSAKNHRSSSIPLKCRGLM